MSELTLNETQQLLRSAAASFVAARCAPRRLREIRDGADAAGFSLETWRDMAGLGWPGIVIPEEFGGLGLGYADLVVVLEELGSVLAPEPFVSSVLLGGVAVLLAGNVAQQSSILPRVVSGELLLALAHHEPGARHDLFRVATRAERSSGDWQLSGEKDFVLDGSTAQQLVVSARVTGEPGDRDGLGLFLVERGQTGLTVEPVRLVDGRAAARVRLDGVRVKHANVLGEPGRAALVIEAVLDRAALGLCAEMLGGMRRAFELTLDYLKTREQFGVKIGSFQALKHRAARMFVDIELGRSTVMAAARALDADAPGARALVSVAKARLSDTFVELASEALQMHGGIGMTDEHDIGLYLKRARVAEVTLGDAAWHRDRWATLASF